MSIKASFLRRFKERRGGGPRHESPPAEAGGGEGGGEARCGPLAGFVRGEVGEEGQDLGQASAGWTHGRQRSRLSKTIRVSSGWNT